MSRLLRPKSISVISLVTGKIFTNLFPSTVAFILPRTKSDQWIGAFLQVRKHGSTLNLFAQKRESCNEIDQDSTVVNFNIGLGSKTIKQLSKMLNCPEEEARILYQNHNPLQSLNYHELKDRVEKIKSFGIEISTIKQNIWVLLFNENKLSARLELLKRWKFSNMNNAVSILQLSYSKLVKHTLQAEQDFDFLNGQNKITYFSSFVKCHEKEACDLFVKYNFMMRINLDILKQILTMARDVGVLTEDLLSDPWLFRYRPQFIADRIQLLDEIDAKYKCKVIKPWMLRCTKSTLFRYFELKDENMAALGSYTNIKDLLSNELNLTDMEVEDMFVKHPPLAKISYSKAKEMIDFLKAEGFGSKMIYQVPRVLCHKQATLLARILELKKINPRVMSLQNLCRNKKDYLAFLNKVQGTHP